MKNSDLYTGMRFKTTSHTGMFTKVEDAGNGYLWIDWIFDDGHTTISNSGRKYAAHDNTAEDLIALPFVINEQDLVAY